MATAQVKINENDKAIVKYLGETAKTLSQFNEVLVANGVAPIKVGTMLSAVRKGLVEVCDKVKVTKIGHRKVLSYELVANPVEVLKADGKPYTITPNEEKVLAALKDLNKAAPLVEIAHAMGLEKLGSGAINGLVKKGRVKKGNEVEVEATTSSEVDTYKLTANAADLVGSNE